MTFGEGLFSFIGMIFFQKDGKMATDVPYLGDRHRIQRKMIQPVFSITHLREIGI